MSEVNRCWVLASSLGALGMTGICAYLSVLDFGRKLVRFNEDC